MKVLRCYRLQAVTRPVSLAKRGLGDHAGQVVHKVVHETVRVAAPRPALADGGGGDGGDEAGGRVAEAAVQSGEERSHLHTVNIVNISALKSSIRRFVITEKAPTRAFSWLKAATTAFTFKTLLRRALTPRSLNVKLGPQRKGHKGQAVSLA